MKELLDAIIVGIVQGLAEFLPISSSGHLVFFQHILGWNKPELFFDILLHAATLGAVLVYYRKAIGKVITTDHRMLALLAAATVPTAIIGFSIKDVVEHLFTSVLWSAVFLSVTGALLMIAQLRGREKYEWSSFTLGSALLIGVIQGMAILPGISRSGSTIALAMLLGWRRADAAQFSFLLSIPAIAGAIVLGLHDFSGDMTIPVTATVAGMIAAFVSGVLAIHVLLKVLRKNKLSMFAYYCWGVGGLIVVSYLVR